MIFLFRGTRIRRTALSIDFVVMGVATQRSSFSLLLLEYHVPSTNKTDQLVYFYLFVLLIYTLFVSFSSFFNYIYLFISLSLSLLTLFFRISSKTSTNVSTLFSLTSHMPAHASSKVIIVGSRTGTHVKFICPTTSVQRFFIFTIARALTNRFRNVAAGRTLSRIYALQQNRNVPSRNARIISIRMSYSKK